MLIRLSYPPGWFRDFDSEEICKTLSQPVIPALDWVRFDQLPLEAHVIVPDLSQLILSAQKNRLHVLEFVSYDTHFIHPKKLGEWFKRNLKRKITGTLRE